jgi:molybdopterin-guanine dinucleotide biosynthesis protein A
MFRLLDPGLGSLVGVVLAGETADATTIQPLLRGLGAQVDALLVAHSGPAERFAALSVPCVADAPGRGPLAGIAAALAWTARAQPRARGILTIPADMDSVPPDLGRRLSVGLPDKVGLLVRGDAPDPMVAVWPVTHQASVAEALARGEERVLAVIRALPHVEAGR